jgi:hypothetical protein
MTTTEGDNDNDTLNKRAIRNIRNNRGNRDKLALLAVVSNADNIFDIGIDVKKSTANQPRIYRLRINAVDVTRRVSI